MENYGTIHFPTAEAKYLFDHELIGQISDGKWENMKTGWQAHVNAKKVADGKSGWEKCPEYIPERAYSRSGMYNSIKWTKVKRSFGFSSKDLLENVGDRMKRIILCAKKGIPENIVEFFSLNLPERAYEVFVKNECGEYFKNKDIKNYDEYIIEYKKFAEEAEKITDAELKKICNECKNSIKVNL